MARPPIMMSTLSKERLNRGLKLSDIAGTIGLSTNVVSRIEACRPVSRPSMHAYLAYWKMDLTRPETFKFGLKIIDHGTRVAVSFEEAGDTAS